MLQLTSSIDSIDEAILRVIHANTDVFTILVDLSGLDRSKDFQYIDLDGVDFSDQDLSGFDFSGSRMLNCNFKNAKVAKANFSRALVAEVALRKAADWKLLREKLGLQAKLTAGEGDSKKRDPAARKAKGINLNVASYNRLLNFVKSEAEARAILAEMEQKGVTPNVVSYSTLLNFVKSEAEGRAILAEMEAKGIIPNSITLTRVIKMAETFEEALGLIDLFLEKKLYTGRSEFEAAFSKPITHLSAEELLAQYEKQPYKFDSSLQNPFNQYRRSGKIYDALVLALAAPHVPAVQKIYVEEYDACKSYFESCLSEGKDDDNIYYALGIAAALNGDWTTAEPNLRIALQRSYAEKRIQHIKRLLARNK